MKKILALVFICILVFCSCDESKNAKLRGYEGTITYGDMSFYEMLDVYAAEQISEEFDNSEGKYAITVEDGWDKASDYKDKEFLLNNDEEAYTYTIVFDGVSDGEQVRKSVRFFCKLIEATNSMEVVELYFEGDTHTFIGDSSEIDDIIGGIFPKKFSCFLCDNVAKTDSNYCYKHECNVESCTNERSYGSVYCYLHD